MKLKLVKMIKNFVKILELVGGRLEVCVSVIVIWISVLKNVSLVGIMNRSYIITRNVHDS